MLRSTYSWRGMSIVTDRSILDIHKIYENVANQFERTALIRLLDKGDKLTLSVAVWGLEHWCPVWGGRKLWRFVNGASESVGERGRAFR